MANIQIPNLPAAISLNGTEQLEAVQAGTTRRITIAQIAGFVQGVPTPFPVSIGGTGASTFTAGYLKADADNPFTTVATIPNTDITGLGTMSTQNANSVTISGGSVTGVTLSSASAVLSGGSINGMSVGATTPSTGAFTDLSASGTITISGTISAPVVVSGSTASAAVRITQTGAGNALLVEDSANPDSTPFVVDATGKVAIGATTAAENLNIVADGRNFLQMTRASTDAIQSVLAFRKSRGTNASPTTAANGDSVGEFQYIGYNGTSYQQLASISAIIDGTVSSTSMPGRLSFSTTPDGSNSIVERMRIRPDGNVGIGSAGSASTSFVVGKPITGATTAYGISASALVQPDVTTQANYYYSGVVTAGNGGTPYTIGTINHYSAIQGTLNADSTVSGQVGYSSGATLIGATNNYAFLAGNTAAVTTGKTAYGFYSGVNTATGGGTTYGFFAAGTAANVFPNINGGTGAASSLTLQSTTGAGTTDSILFKVGNAGAVTALTIGTTGASTFGVSATAPFFSGTQSTSASSNAGAFRYGTMSYSDTDVMANFVSGVSTSYNQIVIENTSAGTNASANVTVANDLGTSTTNFVELGINSSTFSGTGAFGTAGYSYVASASTDLAIGTYGANAIHFVVNTGATDAMTIASTGAVSITSTLSITTSATVPLINGGSAVSSSLALQSTSGAGTSDAIVMRTASQSERVRVDTTGVVTFWQPAQTSLSAAATLTAAQLRTRIIQYTGAAANLTLPTATNIETVITSGQAVDTAFDVTIINTGSGAATVVTNTGITTVGALAVTNGTSGTFRFRKTATNTFTVYRIA